MSRPDRPIDKFGFPIPVSFGEEPRKGGIKLPDSPTTRRWMRRGLVAVVLLGVVTPWLWKGISHQAAAFNQRKAVAALERDDLDAGLRHINKALWWLPRNSDLLKTRASLLMAQRQWESAKKDLDLLIEEAPNDPAAYRKRMIVGRRLGLHDQVLADADKYVQYSPVNEPEPLNERAYFCALENVRLPQALADVEEALKHTNNDKQKAAYLDTRGYIRYLIGQDFDAAAEDLRVALELTETLHAQIDDRAVRIGRRSEDAQGLLQSIEVDMAIMYQHRGLIREKQGNVTDAAADFVLAAKLGYDPKNGVE